MLPPGKPQCDRCLLVAIEITTKIVLIINPQFQNAFCMKYRNFNAVITNEYATTRPSLPLESSPAVSVL